MRSPGDIPATVLRLQREVSDPAVSAWVAANAGSGKTHVLAQRVVNLLLAGVAPEKILCLTFTKAAAANMSKRVFDTLARWTNLDDDALDRAIGAPAGRLPAARRALARFTDLVRRFDDDRQPYRALVRPMWKARYGDYDHLARVKEWSASGPGEEGGE